MMTGELRRVVTGDDGQGRSVVVIDGPPGSTIGSASSGLADVWSTDGGPVDSTATDDRASGPVVLEPAPGGSKFRYFTIPPERPGVSRQEMEEKAAAGFAAMGAAHVRPDTRRHPRMHKTRTIDYIILLKGEVTLLLDEGECDLKPFDAVVQQGTNHAWINKGDEPALLAGVLIDAEVA